MSNQTRSNLKYSNLVSNSKKSLTEISGRYIEDQGKEKFIFQDIKNKLKFKKKDLILDIGCGYGKLVELIIKDSKKTKFSLFLCDIKMIIKKLQKKYKADNLRFIAKNFEKYNFKNLKFDKIIIYSVIQYADNPKNFLKKAYTLLNKNGKILLGDLPNIDKKFRFLNSKFGKQFEKKRKIKRFDLELLTKNYKSFLKNTKQNTSINDKFISWSKYYFKKKRAKVTILKQLKKLPYSFTREDVLIKK